MNEPEQVHLDPLVVELRLRTPEERIEWLTFQVALLSARVGQLERQHGVRPS